MTVYPGYEFFKRLFITLAGPAIAEAFRTPLAPLAAELAASEVAPWLGVGFVSKARSSDFVAPIPFRIHDL